MKRKSTWTLLIVSAVVILLLLLALIKDKGRPRLAGPSLTELPHKEIFFENRAAKLKLAGMLFVPEGSGPFPTAVIIHGSGPSRRDSPWYLSVAQHLQLRGIAVLLPDKRGCERSEDKWIGANFEELATDTVSAIEYVKQQDAFSPSTVGIIA